MTIPGQESLFTLDGIMEIKPDEATAFLLPRHYSGRKPSISKAFGWYVAGELKAVVTFGKPVSNTLCDGVCGKELSDRVYELNRLCRDEDFTRPLSMLVSEALRRLKPLGWIVVSYADTAMHHKGYLYQATNCLYTGKTKERLEMWTGKHSRHYTQEDRESNIRRVRSAKHRYVYFCGSKSQRRAWRKALRYPVMPYPKEENQNYRLGEYIEPVLADKREWKQ